MCRAQNLRRPHSTTGKAGCGRELLKSLTKIVFSVIPSEAPHKRSLKGLRTNPTFFPSFPECSSGSFVCPWIGECYVFRRRQERILSFSPCVKERRCLRSRRPANQDPCVVLLLDSVFWNTWSHLLSWSRHSSPFSSAVKRRFSRLPSLEDISGDTSCTGSPRPLSFPSL